MPYVASSKRYTEMEYRSCGRSGLRLPMISLGLWHNFGDNKPFDNCQAMLRHAFDLGITHFDLANNYGPPPGAAESKFGRILQQDFLPYRDEMIISSKAGYTMWDGPYGDWGSKKYLIASLNQSLKRMGLDYVDIFYHHRPDPNTPLEETMGALNLIVRQGKALYVGISNYPTDVAKEAISILNKLGTPCLIHQPKYSNGIPADSRAAGNPSLPPERLTSSVLSKVKQLNELAEKRGQKLNQMALAWLLRHDRITSVLIGASRISQIDDAMGILKNRAFTQQELKTIELILEDSI